MIEKLEELEEILTPEFKRALTSEELQGIIDRLNALKTKIETKMNENKKD